MSIDPAAVEQFRTLALGFAFSGLLATAFELFTARRASFGLLQDGGLGALACVPVILFSAPFIILRNTVRGRRLERRPIGSVMAATIVACLWSMASGRVMLDLADLLAAA